MNVEPRIQYMPGGQEAVQRGHLSGELLRALLDALDQAIIVWDPASGAIAFVNGAAAVALCSDRGGLSREVMQAARDHREFFCGPSKHGMSGPAQQCRVRGIRWFIRTVALTDDLEVLVCSREVVRESDLLRELQLRYGLTNRQTDVLRCILRGTGGAETAQTLGVSLSTVYKYESELRQLMNVRNNLEVMLVADGIRRHR